MRILPHRHGGRFHLPGHIQDSIRSGCFKPGIDEYLPVYLSGMAFRIISQNHTACSSRRDRSPVVLNGKTAACSLCHKDRYRRISCILPFDGGSDHGTVFTDSAEIYAPCPETHPAGNRLRAERQEEDRGNHYGRYSMHCLTGKYRITRLKPACTCGIAYSNGKCLGFSVICYRSGSTSGLHTLEYDITV